MRTILTHAGLWAGFVLLLILPGSSKPGGPPLWPDRVLYGLELITLCAPPAYVHFVLLERFFLGGRRVVYFASLAATVIGWAALFGQLSTLWPGMKESIAIRVPFILIVVVLTSAFRLLAVVGRQRALIEEARTRQVQAELALLRAQLHPHFLFNTLNNLFGLARRGDPAAADGIARLAHLLRYMIYESGAELVELEREVEQVRRLVDLEKLRFSPGDDIDVALEIDPDLSGARVPPMLLIPFVENAFKHGIRRSARSFVRVSVSARNGTVRFGVENSLHPARAKVDEASAGIGLQNVRRRLELLCPGAHQLSVGPAGDTFRVELTLDTERAR